MELAAIVTAVIGLLSFIGIMFNWFLKTMDSFHTKREALQDEIALINKKFSAMEIKLVRMESALRMALYERDNWKREAGLWKHRAISAETKLNQGVKGAIDKLKRTGLE